MLEHGKIEGNNKTNILAEASISKKKKNSTEFVHDIGIRLQRCILMISHKRNSFTKKIWDVKPTLIETRVQFTNLIGTLPQTTGYTKQQALQKMSLPGKRPQRTPSLSLFKTWKSETKDSWTS